MEELITMRLSTLSTTSSLAQAFATLQKSRRIPMCSFTWVGEWKLRHLRYFLRITKLELILILFPYPIPSTCKIAAKRKHSKSWATLSFITRVPATLASFHLSACSSLIERSRSQRVRLSSSFRISTLVRRCIRDIPIDCC